MSVYMFIVDSRRMLLGLRRTHPGLQHAFSFAVSFVQCIIGFFFFMHSHITRLFQFDEPDCATKTLCRARLHAEKLSVVVSSASQSMMLNEREAVLPLVSFVYLTAKPARSPPPALVSHLFPPTPTVDTPRPRHGKQTAVPNRWIDAPDTYGGREQLSRGLGDAG